MMLSGKTLICMSIIQRARFSILAVRSSACRRPESAGTDVFSRCMLDPCL